MHLGQFNSRFFFFSFSLSPFSCMAVRLAGSRGPDLLPRRLASGRCHACLGAQAGALRLPLGSPWYALVEPDIHQLVLQGRQAIREAAGRRWGDLRR